jgi:hypothetical protein
MILIRVFFWGAGEVIFFLVRKGNVMGVQNWGPEKRRPTVVGICQS